MARHERIETQHCCGRLRGERGALVSHAYYLQRLVVGQCVTHTIAGVDRHERVRIGAHRGSRVQILAFSGVK
jgi:hypothetical protein